MIPTTVIVSHASEKKRKVDSTVELSSPPQVSASFNLADALQALRQTDGEVEVMPVIATGVSAHEFRKWRDEVEKPGCKVCLQVLASSSSTFLLSEWYNLRIRITQETSLASTE